MKKYTASFLILGVMLLGFSFVLPNKAMAGALSSGGISAITSMLQALGANSTTINTVSALLSSSSATGTTSTSSSGSGSGYSALPSSTSGSGSTGGTSTTGSTNTGSITGGTVLPCSLSTYLFNNVTGAPCPKTTSSSGTSSGSTSGGSISPTAASQFSIVLVSPDGGETYSPGEKVVVKWNTQGVDPAETKALLLLNYYSPLGHVITNSKLLSDFTANDGEEEVTLPTTLPSDPGVSWGTLFRVMVSISSQTGTFLGINASNGLFTIK
ncbi:hypothetical protein A2914_00255 [Candidatus Nomurabacteria bacterium RIFCSPLOWO2_01_FULL_41_21]|uniref:Uncharacterized protein n=2 Tax=Candidatus Nomuraibacteriota TaxID=1752729 RepID=A0A1F6V3U3_9BACT|nr:MAG: hypothetical protein A2733_02660 [Candidatus Nomurabacteria bacterium RIFCSPHIGHO2_01_FULL_40_20]OGI88788.1 MAG: hypothetical protein A2914_00255 [Candidatus Nomurabacteria bacterium RIFCSPLOWO2_01_FULL_41_21]